MKTLRILLGLLVLGAACARTSEPARLLVRGATLQVMVASLDGLESNLAQRIAALDGFITRSERTDSGLTMVFRVPASKLETALAAIESLASSVDAREVHGEDVTEEYVDLEAQLANLTASRARLLALLDKAQEVDDALEVNKGLTEVQGQLERVAGKKKFLEQSSALSTVTATFSAQQHGDWRPLLVAQGAARALLACLRFLGSAAIVGAVFSPLWAPVVWWFRRRRARA